MKFDLTEVIKISEYVRVCSKSNPIAKTKTLISEYLEIKKAKQIKSSIDWWASISEKTKWNLTINHLKNWEDFEKQEIFELWLKCGYGINF